MAEIEGDDNNNSITGTTGSDTIRGQDGNDSINGNDGNDTIFGGDGDDTITGGRGDDTIVGGRGDDVMTAGRNSPSDTFLIRDGDGNDTITDFDTAEPDVIAFNMAEIQTLQDVYDRMSADGNDLIITYDNGSTTRLINVDQSNFGAANFRTQSGPICFHAGTIIATPDGPRLVEDLSTGDLVLTRDGGAQPILQAVKQRLTFRDRENRAKPIQIQAGALGQGVPTRDLTVSPQHRMLVRDPQTQQDVLVAAVHLLGRPGIRRMKGRKLATYYNLLLDRHHIITANGSPAETLLLTSYTEPMIDPLLLCPDLRVGHMLPARPILKRDPGATPAHSRVLIPNCS